MKLQAMVGYKLFKEFEDGTIDLIRILNVRKYKDGGDPSEIKIRFEGTGEVKKVRVDSLKGYTPLEPDGLATFNIVGIRDAEGKMVKDVIVTGSKILNIKIGNTLPYAICRQNITDIFYNLLVKDESDMIVGLAVNQDDCPANYDFGLLLACDGIDYSENINFYRTDTLEDILTMVKTLKFDTILGDLYAKHVEYSKDPSLAMKKHDKGWSKDLRTLLKDNQFQNDLDEMLGITEINPEIAKHTVKKTLPNNEEYTSFDEEMTAWLSSIFKINIGDITVLEYNHDINLAEFNNARYFLLRDQTKKLYLAVYTVAGEYFKSDLEAANEKRDFSSEFRINFYNKYNKNK